MIDALCGVAPEEDFVLPDGDVELWTVNQVAGWAATKLSARTGQLSGAWWSSVVNITAARARPTLGLPQCQLQSRIHACCK